VPEAARPAGELTPHSPPGPWPHAPDKARLTPVGCVLARTIFAPARRASAHRRRAGDPTKRPFRLALPPLAG
jgi:hypothetical protein